MWTRKQGKISPIIHTKTNTNTVSKNHTGVSLTAGSHIEILIFTSCPLTLICKQYSLESVLQSDNLAWGRHTVIHKALLRAGWQLEVDCHSLSWIILTLFCPSCWRPVTFTENMCESPALTLVQHKDDLLCNLCYKALQSIHILNWTFYCLFFV